MELLGEAGAPCIWVTGPAGVGRTTLLERVRDRLRGDGRRVSAMRFTSAGDLVPADASPDRPWLAPVAGAADDPEVARRAALAAAAPIVRGGDQVLLLDDTQWIDRDSLAVLEALIRRLAGSAVRLVCATRTPVRDAAAGLAMVRRLRADGLVRPVRLRPLRADEITRLVVEAISAAPSGALRRRLQELSRGVPSALHQALELLRAEGSLRIVDRRAYLVPGTATTSPPRVVRELGPDVLAVAKAAAVLHPLGDAMPALISEVLDQDKAETLELLDILRAEGVLHHGVTWRFTIPVTASALIAELGPFERRQFAAAAVTALWTGTALTSDPDYLADQIAEAGKLIDPARALGELLRRALRNDKPERGGRWLRAAIELTEDRAQRAMVTLLHTSWCHQHGDHKQSLAGARLLLRDFPDQLSADATQEVQSMAVSACDPAALAEIAAGSPDWTPASSAIALSRLDRWADAGALLARTEPGCPTSAMLSGLYASLADLWAGRPERFDANLAARAAWPLREVRRHRTDQIRSHVTALLVIGEQHRAERLLADERFPEEDLRDGERSMLAAMRGEFPRAVDFARRSVAHRGDDAGSSAMHLSTVSVLVAQGRLTAARELLTAARATKPMLVHLLDIADARVDRALGDHTGAAERLHSAIAHGLAVGTDIAWSELADLALDRGDHDTAARCLAELDKLASTMPTGRVLLHRSLVRACLLRGGTECLRRAHDRAQPFETALVVERLVRHGAADPRLLTPTYETLGALDALLYRAWLRNLMREHGIAVPGRQETVAENEHLLALLAAEGLTNKQLATALKTSEKSVEGRLSRLFSRTGYRSRIELATAMLNGDHI
ncbi:regulatory protein, luxR family [Amycolatopsis xylanica]|uniref:Regulatory protein, luxR family n=2 Tax=Amycolatopsis xylanica TaxID=589385 RepID=A0A1H3GWE7_9PSEU|nr:regulatory protein, luxR family [Amycolatopsis xylanica]